MSMIARARSSSQSTRSSNRSNRSLPAPAPSLTPSPDGPFDACAATATYFIYSQRNVILCLHHDTLAIERRFERHKEHVVWIAVDNVSERGGGRQVVSYDASQTTIVWDLLTGDEVARFASFEEIKVAAWMRNGNIAFGNAQGNVILFEPPTVEHISARTIFDPITALAPAADCRTFAIGYMNGSILIAALQPSFTILHTLSTTRAPSPMSALAWHGSSSKQKSDMLAAQTADGDLRIWSIPKHNIGEPPSIIRVLHRPENDRVSGPCWFGWSKMGRIVQYSDGLTFVWDVRTKKVTYESVPTVDGIVGIANYGPTATLFTLGRNHTVQQYDLNPNARAPQLVQNVQHVPAALPPSPPISDGEQGKQAGTVTAGASDPRAIYFEAESSGEEGVMTMSPLQRVAQGLDQLEDERRDQLGALSPVSSRSSLSSRSANAYARYPRSRSSSKPHLTYEKPPSPGMISSGSSYGTGTTFSSGAYRAGAIRQPMGRESVSIRTISSSTSTKPKTSRLRQEVLRSPDEPLPITKELFPFTKARLTEVPFVPPIYDQNKRTPDDLRRQMLQTVFGWQGDVESLIRDEVARHPPGSPGPVLLSKWLGDLGSDSAASMVGSASLSSSDWMLLALSAMGSESQKKVGEAFVERLLAKGDIHPAVAILLGLGEPDEAVEAYVSRKCLMEAILLTCLVFPLDWGRQSHLVRRWGEQLVSQEPKQPELAVRCFSCTSVESSEPWFSPRAQDAIYAAQQTIIGPSPPLTSTTTVSPPNSATYPRMNPAQAGLKLITNFAPPQNHDPVTVIDDKTPMTHHPGGVTPIDSAVLSPDGYALRPSFRGDPASAASARTMTPGGYERKRYPSRGALDRLRGAGEAMTPVDETSRTAIPMTAFKNRGQGSETSYGSTIHRTRSLSTGQARTFSPTERSMASSTYQPQVERERGRGLPSPAHGVFTRLTDENRARNGSRDRKPDGLTLHMDDIVTVDPSLPTGTTNTSYSMLTTSAVTGGSFHTRGSRRTAQSADADLKSSKIRSIDEYINSLDAAQNYARERVRSPSRHRGQSREGRSSRRAPSEGRGRQGVRYVKPAKRSPSSPVSMSPDDPALLGAAAAATAAFEDERYYKLIAPTEAQTTRPRERSRGPDATSNSARAASKSRRRGESSERSARMRSVSRHTKSRSSRPQSPSRDIGAEPRGRSRARGEGSVQREPSGGSAQPESPPDLPKGTREVRARSTSRRAKERGTSHSRTRSPDRRLRERSRSAKRPLSDVREVSIERPTSRPGSRTAKSNMPKLVTNLSENSVLTKKELAAQELEARRLSLARRPSVPAIPHPAELEALKEPTSARSPTGSPGMPIPNERQLMRSMSVDPDTLLRAAASTTGISTSSAPIGLPATPRAMRHPKYMAASPDDAPAVPDIPESFAKQTVSANNSANASAEPSPNKQGPPSPPMLLPATTFQPGRSSSAPMEKMSPSTQYAEQRAGSTRPEFASRPFHPRKLSAEYQAIHPPATGTGSAVASPAIGSISEELALANEQNVIVVEASPNSAPPPAVLPELQHLAGPPPPPPPPTMYRHMSSNSLGILDPSDMRHPTPAAMTMAPRQTTPQIDVQQPASVSSSPAQTHRRGRGSMSETMGQKLRSVTTRLRERSTSRNRTKSPPQPATYTAAPYESIPPAPVRRGSTSTTQTRSPAVEKGAFVLPYESTYVPTTMGTPAGESIPTTTASPAPPIEAPPQTTYGGYRNPKDIAKQYMAEQMQLGAGAETAAGAEPAVAAAVATSTAPMPSKSTTPYSAYRNPKEIRANMPPEYTQMGVVPIETAEK